MIGEHKLGKLMSATIHEDGHEFSLVLNFPIRNGGSEHGGKSADPFKGKNMSIFKNTVVGAYPSSGGGGNKQQRSKFNDFLAASGDEIGLVESETDPSDVETAVHSLVSQKDKDIFGNTNKKIKNTKKKPVGKKEPRQENSHLSSVNRLLFTELGEKGSGDIETVKQLLREEDSEVNCINSANESLLIVAVKNKREDCIKVLIEHGIDVNRKLGPHGNTALHEAVTGGNSAESIVQTLLSAGANANKKNDKGKSPYTLATEKGYENIVAAIAANLGQEMLEKQFDQKLNTLDEINY